jgi:hypothetical protein
VPLALEARGRHNRMLEKAMQSSTATAAMKLRVDATIRGEFQQDLEAALPQLSPRTAALATPGVPEVERPQRPPNQMQLVEEAGDPSKHALLQKKFFSLASKPVLGNELDGNELDDHIDEEVGKEAARAYQHKRQGWRGGAVQLGTCFVMCVRSGPSCSFRAMRPRRRWLVS